MQLTEFCMFWLEDYLNYCSSSCELNLQCVTLHWLLLPTLSCSPLQTLINNSWTAAVGNHTQIGSIPFLWLRISRLSFHLPSRIASIDWSVVCSRTMTGFQRLSQIQVCLGRSAGRRACVWDKTWFHSSEPTACSSFLPAFFYFFYLLITSGLKLLTMRRH